MSGASVASGAFDAGRRRALAALAGAFASLPAAAQDPRASLAQRAARDWLALVDRGDVKASWEAAAPQFRRSIDLARWTQSLPVVRGPLGALESRTLVSTQFFTEVPGYAEKGDYAVLVFRAVFVKRVGSSERVTLSRGDDGIWRVAGYVVA